MAEFKSDFQRPPEGWRFELAGANVSSSPDSLKPNKYATLLNARTSGGTSIRARPAAVQIFGPPVGIADAPVGAVTDLAGFAALGTNNLPIIVSRYANNAIALNGAIVTFLDNSVPCTGVSFLPFRPNESPQAWMYVAAASDFQKIQAPGGPAQKVGIAEPQVPCDAAAEDIVYTEFTGLAVNWAPDGSVAAPPANGVRSTDTLIGFYLDPASTDRYSVEVSRTIQYQIGETVLANGTLALLINDVLPPFSSGAGLGVQTFYFNATTGNTMIVPTQMGLGTTVNEAELGQLRRGALVLLRGSTFAGTGLNDATISGSYTGIGLAVIVLTIDGLGSPDTFSWSLNGGAVTSHVAMSGSPQALADGLSVTWGHVTGHTLGDASTFVAAILFVLDSVTGPNGTIAFEVAGNIPVPANANIVGVPAISVNSPGLNLAYVGTPLTAADVTGALAFVATPTATEAIGTYSQPLATNPFASRLGASTFVPQADDYVHLSILVSDPTQINEIKLIFNVDPTVDYLHNVFYYSVRPSDLASVATNAQTQLAAILEASTNALIENQVVPTGEALIQAALNTTVSDIASAPGQTSAGSRQWTEITFPISSLQFLGGNENCSLMNCNGVQIMFNTSGSVSVAFGSLWLGGGGQPDIGITGEGAPYQYRLVPRSTLTGTLGNPTPAMWYGVRPTRQAVDVTLPAAIEAQQDIWDVYRYGGSVLEYRWIGTGPPLSKFVDNFFDDAAKAGNALEVDNFEPFPSIDVPFQHPGGLASGVYILLSTGVFAASMPRWLPGTLIQLPGNQAYTLRRRPQFLSPTQVLLTCEEAIGNLPITGQISVYEPKVARQFCNYGWGPNEYGDYFFCGDPLRPGVVYFCKSNNPDSAPDKYNLEISDPSQPLIGGVAIAGMSLVASPDQWWALYPAFDQSTRYSKRGAAVGRGLVSPWAICTDGKTVYFWAKDCIAKSAGGPYESLTDPDLYVLFPHEGTAAGQNVTRLGVTFYAPDYSRVATFRLSWANQYLFADYQDTTGTPRTLVCDLRTGGWCSDDYGAHMTVHARLAQQAGSLSPTPALYQAGILGDSAGNIYHEQDGGGMTVVVGTFEWDGGDLRAAPLFGDSYLDCLPSSQIAVQPVSLGQPVGSETIVPASPDRAFVPISLGGGDTIKFLGLAISWNENYTGGIPTTLYLYQHSASPQPETTTDRAADWTDAGTPGNKWFQGFLLDADTMGADKALMVEDSETDTLHAIQPAKVNFNGRGVQAYSFAKPFFSHLVRDIPQDAVPWRKYAITYIFQPAPESAQTWQTQATAFGGNGYPHIGRLETAYAATSDILLTITAQDGTSPLPITLPKNGGVYGKLMVLPTFNKGQSYIFQAISEAPFQLYLNDWIVWVGAWGRETPYQPYRLLGGVYGDQANV